MPENYDKYQWTERHSQLNDALAALVPYPINIPYYIDKAELNAGAIAFAGTAYDIWNSVIHGAIVEEKVDKLVLGALSRFPKDPFLKTALEKDEIVYSLGPKIDEELSWEEVSEQTLEVLTLEDLNTLMPISFLQQGVEMSKSVAKVQIIRNGVKYVGSGFLTADNIFITNNHVIPDKKTASIARVLFNYEEDMKGEPRNDVRPFDLDPDWFDTSPVAKYDYTAVRIKKEDANKEFSALELTDARIGTNDFVNIIQHPAGHYKKIALYHNIVTHSDERKIQYLTDTLKGSSGSPVFNSKWQVVALHHSGGLSKENEEAKKISKFRNEGININRVIEGIKKAKDEKRL